MSCGEHCNNRGNAKHDVIRCVFASSVCIVACNSAYGTDHFGRPPSREHPLLTRGGATHSSGGGWSFGRMEREALGCGIACGSGLNQSDAVLLVVNVCDTPLSEGDYVTLSEQLYGIRREIVFLREFEDSVSDAFYERKIEEWKLVL